MDYNVALTAVDGVSRLIPTVTTNRENKLPYQLLLDEEDYERAKDLKIIVSAYFNKPPSISYQITLANKTKKLLNFGRFIMRVEYLAPSKAMVVHSNDSPFDFRKETLKVLSSAEFRKMLYGTQSSDFGSIGTKK